MEILRSALIGGVLAVAVLMPEFAVAEGEGAMIEELVVTARRRAESVQDVPGTVTAIGQSTIEGAGVERVEDFIRLTPGVTLVNTAEVGDTQVNIRGINGARDAENSFAFIVDGILHTNPAAFNREYPGLQQIEVFKGPQGAIYGRNAAAGAVIVTTERPTEEFTGSIKTSYANDDSLFVQGTVSGPIVEDELFFRLSGTYRDTDGFWRNEFKNDSSTIDRFKNYDIDGRLLWEPNDRLSVDMKGRYGEVDASAITFNATFHLPIFAEGANAPAAFEDVNDHEFVFQHNVDSDNNQEALELSVKADYEFENGYTLTGWMLYSDIQNDFIADGTSAAFGFFQGNDACLDSTATLNAQGVILPPPQILGASPVGIIFTPDFSGSFFGPYTPTTCDGIQEQVRDQDDFSFELRLASPVDQALRWMGGVYFLTIDRQVGISLNTDSGEKPIRGLLQTSGPNRTEALVYDDFESDVFAVFGQLEYDITDAVELSFALRYDREERDVSNLVPTDVYSTVIDLVPGDEDPLNPGLIGGAIPDKSKTFEEIQPKVALTWDVTEDFTIFGTWGKGFKAGGFNNQGSQATVDGFINGLINGDVLGGPAFADILGVPLPQINDDFEEETSSAFEVGFKSQLWDGRLSLEGAAYYVEVDDMQFFEFFVGTFGLLRVVSNLDEVEIYGFELAATAQLHDYVSVYAGANIIESEIKDNSARPDTVGNDAPYTPDYTFNVGAELNYPLSGDLNLFARVDAQFVGDTWFHTVQSGQRPTIFSPLFEISIFGEGSGPLGFADFENSKRDAYVTVDVRAGIQGENWSVLGFAKNIGDEKYLEEVIPAPEFGGAFDHPGARRRYGVEVSYRF
ncbi:MAG TPA: TonB-dependent receptor [Pseudomonadales bacterium]